MASSTCIACTAESHLNHSHSDKVKFSDSLHTCEENTNTNTDSSAGTASAYTFDNYQEDTGITAVYPSAGTGSEKAATYATLGLAGEAGEIANKWKKLFRDAPNFATHPAEYFDFYASLRETVLDELGDVLWYASQLATELGSSFGEVAAANIRKLNDRKSRDVLHGSGDDR